MTRMHKTALLALTLPLSLLTSCHASFQAGSGSEPASSPTAAAPAATPTPTATATPTPAATTTPAETSTSSTTSSSAATVKGDRVQIAGNIVFDTGTATIQAGPDNEAILNQLKTFLEQNPNVTELRIEGHTDNVGNAEDNLNLSGQRALAIKKWLVDKGIAASRLLAVGFGDQNPIADNSTEEGRAQNRRTEFRVATLNGKNYLGKDPKGGGKVFE